MGHDTAKEQRRALAHDLTEESAAHAASAGNMGSLPVRRATLEIRSKQATGRWCVQSPGGGPC